MHVCCQKDKSSEPDRRNNDSAIDRPDPKPSKRRLSSLDWSWRACLGRTMSIKWIVFATVTLSGTTSDITGIRALPPQAPDGFICQLWKTKSCWLGTIRLSDENNGIHVIYQNVYPNVWCLRLPFGRSCNYSQRHHKQKPGCCVFHWRCVFDVC